MYSKTLWKVLHENTKLILCIFTLYPGYTWKAGLKMTKTKLDFIKDEHLLLLLENNIRGGISSVMGDRYVQSTSDMQSTSIFQSN